MLGSPPQEHAQFLVARQKTTLYIYSEKLRVKKKDNPWKVKNELPEKDSHHQRKHPAAVSQDVLDQRWAHGHQAPQAAGGGLCPWAWVTPHGFTHLKLLQGVLKTWPKSLISEVVLDFFSRVLFQWIFFFPSRLSLPPSMVSFILSVVLEDLTLLKLLEEGKR